MEPNEPILLDRAIELAEASVLAGGGPFGALVAQGGRIIAEGQNRVVLSRDPTAHAEIAAIRAACAALSRFELSGCSVYASCEPCPMCLAALYWARVDAVVYACTREDADQAGFDDQRIYGELARPPRERALPMRRLDRPGALDAFRIWREIPNRQDY
jgi:tRNA(Arg) A34 adenosine deaminase TadA